MPNPSVGTVRPTRTRSPRSGEGTVRPTRTRSPRSSNAVFEFVAAADSLVEVTAEVT